MTKKKVAAAVASKGKKVDTPAPPAPKAHERKAKPGEKNRLEKGRKLAGDYLVHRDGMDPEVARMVVEGMEADEIDALIVEANTAVIEKTKATPAAEPAAVLAGDDEDDKADFIDFNEVPELRDSEEFPLLVYEAVELSKTKNEAEKRYKADKAKIIALMKDEAKVMRAICGDVKLTVYPGAARWIDERKLLEKGVSIDIIKECWSETPWWDVRLTVPKAKG
jgi:hypothetical protein